MLQPQNILWILHLLGGARAVWGDQGKPMPAEVEPRLLSGGTLKFTGTSLPHVMHCCGSLGFQLIGAALFTHEQELKGRLPARWRPIHYMPNSTWLCYDEQQKWSEIAHAAQKNQIGRLWDCSARISYQIGTCIARLQEISDGYAVQLLSLGERKPFPDQSRVVNLWTQSIFRSIQAFFAEACILRDYLAEFTAEYVYRLPREPRITTMAKLLPHLRQINSSDQLTVELKMATETAGWLALLGDYRNLVVHSAPLAMAKKHLWVWCQTHELPDGNKLPSIRIPLPHDPAGIMALRRKTGYDKFSAIADQFLGSTAVDSSMIDALRYSHEVLGKLAELSSALTPYSPAAPEIPVLTDDDIIGTTEWNPT